tara:strand:- start:2735 stop:5065 length:2331 start_codon:yes stop_codon:yes gene_type:complete
MKSVKKTQTTKKPIIDPILLIVESPAKCNKIESYLGAGYKAIASYGHIQELNGLKSVDIKNGYKPFYNHIMIKEKQIKKIREAINKSSEVLIATDDDREGEGIGWHICQVFNLPVQTTKRIIFHEITKDALHNAVNNPTLLNMNVVFAQQGRQVLDLLVGYKISPLLWKHIARNSKDGLSAGRCQTPALRLIYDNQKEIDESPGKKVYNLSGNFTKNNLLYTLNKTFENSEKDVETFLEESVNFEHKISCSKPKDVTKNPPIPFSTSGLQQKSSNELHITPKETMSICQKLYESGLITYMRTDSLHYAPEFIEKINKTIKEKYGEEYILKQENKKLKKKKKDNAQEAHESIRPTNIEKEKIDDTFSAKEKKMYQLIWTNTMESCMAPAIYQSITSSITAPQEALYKYSSEKSKFLGWKIVKGGEDGEFYEYIMKIKNNNIIEYNKIFAKLTIKDIKSHYNEAKLVQLLEQKGIGRPSTFSSLVEKIQERQYVKKQNVKGKKITCTDYELEGNQITEKKESKEFGNEKNKLVIQPVGTLVLDFCMKHFDDIFNYDYTKNMENDLDKIANGDKTYVNLCKECDNNLTSCMKELKSDVKNVIEIDENHVFMVGKYGPVIKYEKDGETTFYPVKEDVNIEKIKNGEVSLDEIKDEKSKNNILGKYENEDLIVKKGKFGLYVVWGENKKSLQGINIDLEDLNLENVTRFINLPKQETNQNILRLINEDLSVRKGKFGNYIFYKTTTMKKPQFLKLAKCPHDYLNCDINVLHEWIKETYLSK